MAAKLMRALQYDAYGGGPSGLKHVEVPIPTPKKDEILLKLEAATINPIDWKVQKGLLRPFLPRKFPYIPGADEVLDYKTPEGAALNSPSGRKYDAVIHCASSIPWSAFEPNLSPNGKVVDITPGPSALLTFAMKKLTFSKKQLVPLIMNAKAENLYYLVRLVKEGKLKTVIDSKYPLSKAEEAWAKSIDGHATGKIIVEP